MFAQSHVEIRRWFDEGLVDGLRVDHPDGCATPRATSRTWPELTGGAYCLVEKILEPGEELPASWSTEGTTGYDALAFIDRVLTDPAGQAPLDALETRLRGHEVDWHELIHDTKRAVADGSLHSEVNRITRELLATGVGPARRTTWPTRSAELLACFPVYRSYLPDGREHLDEAVRAGPRAPPGPGRHARRARCRCSPTPRADPALRFQQTSGMVMAKGVEDCAFYRCSRLTSLNEVGGDPSVFATTPAAFHGWAARPAARVARRDDLPVDPRHQARRGRPRPDHRARRDPRRLGGRARRAARARPAARPRLRRAALAGRRRRLAGAGPGPAGPGCTGTPRRRCARPATGPRGPRPTRTTRRPCTRRSTPPSTTRGWPRSSRTWWPGPPGRAGATRSPPSCWR